MISPRRGPAHGLALALALCGAAQGAQANAAPGVAIAYIGVDATRPPPATMIDAPPRDTGLRGAQLAVADTNTTGRFTNQHFDLRSQVETTAAAATTDFTRALAAGQRIFITDVPAAALLHMADAPGAETAVILDATSADDRLRGADCRANTLHLLPSRAMLADALMQYLAVKNWRRVMLLSGSAPQDALFAAAIRASADKFQISIAADRPWAFNPAAQQADTGHYQINDEVEKATQGAEYDVLIAADEAGAFGTALAYRTHQPRPIAGTAGLVPTAWAPAMDEYASTQLQTRFFRATGRGMTPRDYGAWLAVRAVGEAATRTASTDPARIIAYLHGPDFTLSGYKGPELSFRSWDGQLRQPVLLADAASLVSISPQPGFLHQTNELDTLGPDQPETACHFK